MGPALPVVCRLPARPDAIWPNGSNDDEGINAAKAVLAYNQQHFARTLVVSLYDMPRPDPGPKDTPKLPEFRAKIGTDGSAGANSAAKILEQALCEIDVDLRHCKVDRSRDLLLEPNLTKSLSDAGCAHVSIGLPQVHFQPDGSVYPLLFHDLAVGVFDALRKLHINICRASS